MVALQGWAQQLEGGGLLRGAVRLNELLNPGFFLTALRQQTARVSQLPLNPNPSPTPTPTPSPNQARVSQLPMDGLHLVCALSAAELGDTALSFEVDGLLLQGASCAAPHGLAPLAEGAGTFAPLPPLHLAWVATDRRDPYPLDKSALIPIYENQTRESLLSEVRLDPYPNPSPNSNPNPNPSPTPNPNPNPNPNPGPNQVRLPCTSTESIWLQAGCALFLSVDA